MYLSSPMWISSWHTSSTLQRSTWRPYKLERDTVNFYWFFPFFAHTCAKVHSLYRTWASTFSRQNSCSAGTKRFFNGNRIPPPEPWPWWLWWWWWCPCWRNFWGRAGEAGSEILTKSGFFKFFSQLQRKSLKFFCHVFWCLLKMFHLCTYHFHYIEFI